MTERKESEDKKAIPGRWVFRVLWDLEVQISKFSSQKLTQIAIIKTLISLLNELLK